MITWNQCTQKREQLPNPDWKFANSIRFCLSLTRADSETCLVSHLFRSISQKKIDSLNICTQPLGYCAVNTAGAQVNMPPLFLHYLDFFARIFLEVTIKFVFDFKVLPCFFVIIQVVLIEFVWTGNAKMAVPQKCMQISCAIPCNYHK